MAETTPKTTHVVAHVSPLAPQGLVYVAAGKAASVETDQGRYACPPQTFFAAEARRFASADSARGFAAMIEDFDLARPEAAADAAPWRAWSMMAEDAEAAAS